MTDRNDKQKVLSDTHVDEPRNQNLTGGKSTQVHPHEAQVEQQSARQRHPQSDREPAEVKATADILPEDARIKSDHSAEE